MRLPKSPAALLLGVSLIAAACTSGGAPEDASPGGSGATTVAPPGSAAPEVDQIDSDGERLVPEDEKPDLEVALIWHQHQPRYPVVDGTITRPWVRLHAAKDYLDMAQMVTEFPDLQMTINLTPVLLEQLVELESGVNDSYEAVARVPIADLTPEQRRFTVERFFDINPRIVDQSERYKELRAIRETGGEFSDADIGDLRTLFHLGWIDPEFITADTRLDSLRTKGRRFSDADTAAVLDAIDDLVARVIPTHAELWNTGQLELITSPLAHPILPLIADSDLALEGDPSAILPREPFREPADAADQVSRGLSRANELLGQTPNGMWPGEGAIAQEVMGTFAANSVEWVASGEDVLARSVGTDGFGRDANGTVTDSTSLYRPYTASTPEDDVAIFFRDNALSDLIGFEYATRGAEAAAADMVERLDDIRSVLARSGVGPDDDRTPIVTLVVDGENAWESYPNDGRDFLRALYARFTITDWLRTTTPSQYLSDHPDDAEPLAHVFPAAWFSPDFTTWIGEQEEARAWELLRRSRADLDAAERRGTASAAQLEAAKDLMLQAQGSDWFWWYGADQDSGDDRYFDNAFRELLGQMYEALGQDRPSRLLTPIIPDPRVIPVSSTGEAVSVVVDGNPADFSDATVFDFTPDADVIAGLSVAIDNRQVGLLLEGGYDQGVDIYLGLPEAPSRRSTSADERFDLGFEASHLVRWTERDGACLSTDLDATAPGEFPAECTRIDSALSASGLEMAIPAAALGALTAGDELLIRMQTGSFLSPSTGPAVARVPDIASFVELRELADPVGDDYGPGGYSYPTDDVFVPGTFDLVEVVAGEGSSAAGESWVFSFLLDAPIPNPWNSPNGLSLPTIDLYLDYDPGARTGRRALIDGRNASLPADSGWEAALVIEGWESAIATPNRAGGYNEIAPGPRVSVLGERGLVTVRVLKTSLPAGLDLQTAGIGVAVLSQDGFAGPALRRVRDVTPQASRWTIGGGDSATGDTRILDAGSAVDSAQESGLGGGVLPLWTPSP